MEKSSDYRYLQNLRKWTAALRASVWRGAPRKQGAQKNGQKRQLPALWRMRKESWRPRKWAVNLLLRYENPDNSTTVSPEHYNPFKIIANFVKQVMFAVWIILLLVMGVWMLRLIPGAGGFPPGGDDWSDFQSSDLFLWSDLSTGISL